MNRLIKTKSFKNFIESVGKGCTMIFADIENKKIHVWCKANSQNNIIFKIILDDNECVDLINSFGLYNKENITEAYKSYLNNLKKLELNYSI